MTRPKIFDEQIARKPNHYPWTTVFIEAMHKGFWTDKLFSFSSDIQDFKVNLTEEERQIIIRSLSAIGQIEVAVKTFWAKLGENLPHPSLYDLGYVMANVEVIHNLAYERLISVLGLEQVFEDNLKLKWINGRVKYLKKYTHKYYKDSKKQYLYALILFTLFVENVSLFSQFYVINWFGRYKNVLKDTNQQVMYTRLEEGIHAEVGMQIVNTIKEEYPELFDKELEDKIIHEAQQAFESESEIINWIMGDYKQNGLDKELLKEFIKNRINDSLERIGFKKPFEINKELLKSAMWFEEEVAGNNITDFFKGRPVEYGKISQTISEEDLF